MNRKNKQPKKLALQSVTVRTLLALELESVAGGLPPTPAPTTIRHSMQGSCNLAC